MNAWSVALVSLAIFVFVASPALGLFLFTPRRARSLKHAEAVDEQQAVIAHISYIRLRHPEIVRAERLDRHASYVWLNLSLLAFGCVVAFVAVPYSNLGSESLGTRTTLAVCLMLGSSSSLIGSLFGKRIWGHCIVRSVCHNDTSPMLGDDIRVPYVLAWVGLASTAISMGFYGYTVIASAGTPRLLTTLGGAVSFGVVGMCLTLIPAFIGRIRSYITARDVVLIEAAAIIAEQDSQDGHS